MFFAYYISSPPPTRSFACYMRPYSSPFLSFLAYGGSLRSVSSHRTWGPPQISFLTYYESLDPYAFFSYYMEAPRIISLHTILGPPITFFAYYMGPLRSVSSHTIWWPISHQFHCLLYGPPPPLRSVSLHAIGGPPQILVFSQNIWGPPSDQFLRLLYGAPSDQFLCILFELLSDQFFLLLYGAPSDQFLRLLYGGPLRLVSSLTI